MGSSRYHAYHARQWNLRNPDKVKEYQQTYQQNNADFIHATSLYRYHRDKLRETVTWLQERAIASNMQ